MHLPVLKEISPFGLVIDLFLDRFDYIHIDEFGNVLNVTHLLRFLTTQGKLLGTGDLRQLPAYQNGCWILAPAMRYATVIVKPSLLERHYRLPCGLDQIVNKYFL